MSRLTVYLAGPITEGREDREDWREETRRQLAFHLVEAKLPRPLERYVEEYGIDYSDAAGVLTVRDWKFATQCDVVLANFAGSVKPSIGTCIELGWASQARVPIVSVLPEGNVHNHPMIDWCSTFIVTSLEMGISVVLAMAGERFD